ncbi:MAG: 50S ribosomal protein L24 [Candidatus Eisenbacteria bacterium]|nr:50S ribosomal protein L24 [Candidatus Eisenbacteria bacterium]
MKIRKGDTVVVVRGDDKGKTGRVLSVDPDKKLVWVQRVRLVTRHKKGGQQQRQRGGMSTSSVEKEAPLPVSSVALIDPKSNKPARIRMQVPEAAEEKVEKRRSKARISKSSGVEIERPIVKSKA